VQQNVLLFADSPVAAVPVVECGEPLVDLREVPELRVDEPKQDADECWAKVRVGVRDRLLRAQRLLPADHRLLVIEGFRPVERQRRSFEEHVAKVAKRHPQLNRSALHREVSLVVSPPQVAPHCTGGAIDLTLCHDDGTEFDMGTPVNADPFECESASYTTATSVSAEAIVNRAVLGSALEVVGFINYPTKWWHWSYGERYWAAVRKTVAIYGSPVGLPAPSGPASEPGSLAEQRTRDE
jgi:D-alanyl-D-alanine dipeptidase